MTPNISQSSLLPERRSFPAGRHSNSPYHTVRRLRGLAVAARRLLIRMACLFLAVALLSTSTPAAPLVLADVAASWRGEVGFWLRTGAGGWAKKAATLLRAQGNSPAHKPQEKQEDRDARVRRVKIYPGDVTIDLQERVAFSAAALDSDGQPVGGVVFRWSASDEGRGGHASRALPRGEFKSVAPGTFKVTAEAGGNKDEVKVTVLASQHRGGQLPPRTFSSRERRAEMSAVRPPRRGSRRGVPRFVKASFTEPASAPPALLECSDDSQWNECNYGGGSDPDNRRGNPPGSPLDGGAGNGNFQIAAPVLSLPGRGVSVALGLVYNSRVWTKNGTKITYDIDHDWPAAGWSLGLGRMNDLGNGGGMIEDADGTRHSLSGSFQNSTGNFHTTDGSLINYSTMVNDAGAIVYAQANYPNGTIVWYGAAGAGAVYPTIIQDANGNYVTVTYVNDHGPQIQTITDTLGRVVNFYYDSNNLLTAITGPALTSGTRLLVRLHYKQLPTLSAAFTGLTPVVRSYTPWALDAVYYPATGTGYWFGDSDSYSSYGMIQKVVEQRGMGFSGPDPQPPGMGPTEQGTVTQGTMSLQQVYGFQTSNLTDAPTFTSLTESYDGMETAAAVTNFSAQPNASPRTATVTLPDGTQSVQYSNNHPGSYDDGLVYRDETKDSAGNLLRSSDVVWQPGDYDSPRPISTSATNEQTHQRTGTEFSYQPSPSYNQVIEARAYDYGYTYSVQPNPANVLLRKVVTAYNTSAAYVSNHIFNLPASVETYDGAGARLSRTEYEYDGATPANAPGVVSHNPNYDPYNTDTVGGDECCEWGSGPDGFQFCQQMCPAQPVFHPETNYRGLVTKVTTYSNVTSQQATGAITETRAYDMTGNMVTATTSCCQQMSFEYTSATQYVYPESKTRGAATDPLKQVKTSATYDFDTGLALTATDANGRTSSIAYYTDALRPQMVTLPAGGHTDFDYNDTAMTVTETTYLAAAEGGAVADQNVKYLNGAGGVRQEKALSMGNVWDFVDTHYDQMGRVSTQTRPYRSGDAVQLTTTSYDALGRVWKIEAPDHSVTQAFFDDLDPTHPRPDAASMAPGETTLLVDAWGRERWGRYDSQGHLVEVVEPKPDGGGPVTTGGWVTTYSYDALGRLTGTNQGGQVRSFAYDSLGRLVKQKLAEATATLDDTGAYVGAGGANARWSDAFAYDDHSNLTRLVDARGVVTNFDYNDPLNRLQSVSYDLSGPHESLTNSPISAAPTISYTYRAKASGTDLVDITQLDTVTATLGTTTVSGESYLYDTQARVRACTLTVNGRPPMRTDYSYDTLNRVTDVLYSAQNLATGSGRKMVHQDYDAASRLSGLKVDGVDYASQLQYNAASQTTELKVGAAGANQVTESYDFDPLTGLLSNQKAYRGTKQSPTMLLDLSYNYLRAGTTLGRTGQLTKITDNLNPQKGRTYSYDALGRLTQATGGDPAGTPSWTQTYSYDRWGNRTGVTATGFTAEMKAGEAQKREQVAANHAPPLPEFLHGDERKPVSDAPDSPRLFGAAANTAASGAALLGAPTNLQVTQTSGATQTTVAQVTLQWDAVDGADHYQVERKDAAGQYTFTNVSATSTTFADTGVSSGAAYLYWVRAVDGTGSTSASSNVALGTAYSFTDDPIITLADDPSGATVTKVRAVHITELRQAVNAVRHLAGLGDYNWTNKPLTPNVSPIAADDVRDLRTALGAALTVLRIPLPTYNPDPTIYNGQNGQRTIIKRDHISQLREAATRGRGAASGSGSGTPVPPDGLDGLTYDSASNRVSTAGWEYDASGSQTRARSSSGGWQRYEYDAAGRLARVLSDDRSVVLAAYTYGASNERLVAEEGGARTYYVAGGPGVMVEYAEAINSTQPQWSRSYVYLGARLLSVITPDGGGGEYVEYHHPDRLGTRLISNSSNSSVQEQSTLPYGTVLQVETSAATNRRFTSYDRSQATGLDYAVNRHYDPQQGRFTQVDPIGMGAASLANPQSLNLYSYCGNDPVNNTDSAGLFWGKLFHFLGKAFKWAGIALAVAAIVVTAALIFAPASSFIFKAALWSLMHVLLPLSHLPVLGAMVPLYGLSSPSWNPKSKGFFGNSWQQDSGTCPPGYRCDVYDPVPVDGGIIYASSWWDRFAHGLSDTITDKSLRAVAWALELPNGYSNSQTGTPVDRIRYQVELMNRDLIGSGIMFQTPAGVEATTTEAAAEEGTVIGKLGDLEAPGAVSEGENTIELYDLGSPKANWSQNYSRLRQAMRSGNPIRDASVDPATGALTGNTGFLRAERSILANHGWRYNPGTRMWYPPR